ncbi:nuclear transport factor 2 family protein [Actinophytocola sp.]|uniref:nuclear transport factor 2 family protein n=1 Tax=Actinophytocola sp. TaxID=1872138 RepID=UPI002EDB5E89
MGAAENKTLMRHLFTEVAKGNSRPFVDALADDVRWTIIGSTAWSGTYSGKEAVLADLLRPVNGQLMGRNIIAANRFVAEDDLVVVEAQGRNTTKAGVRYHNAYCWVCRLTDGKLVELTEYADTQLIASALRAPD